MTILYLRTKTVTLKHFPARLSFYFYVGHSEQSLMVLFSSFCTWTNGGTDDSLASMLAFQCCNRVEVRTLGCRFSCLLSFSTSWCRKFAQNEWWYDRARADQCVNRPVLMYDDALSCQLSLHTGPALNVESAILTSVPDFFNSRQGNCLSFRTAQLPAARPPWGFEVGGAAGLCRRRPRPRWRGARGGFFHCVHLRVPFLFNKPGGATSQPLLELGGLPARGGVGRRGSTSSASGGSFALRPAPPAPRPRPRALGPGPAPSALRPAPSPPLCALASAGRDTCFALLPRPSHDPGKPKGKRGVLCATWSLGNGNH